MDIKYLGHASFFIKTKDARVVTDPFNPSIGIRFPKTEADIVTVSHQHGDHNNIAGVNGSPLVVDWPGEFESKGIRVSGFKTFHDKEKGAKRGEDIVYRIDAEDISILHCGDLGLVPDDNFIDNLGNIDVLMVPVGGFYTIDAADACAVVKKIDPYIVIPMHYNQPQLDQKTFGSVTGVDEFIKKIGVTPETINKLTLKKDTFGEEMKVVVMEISTP